MHRTFFWFALIVPALSVSDNRLNDFAKILGVADLKGELTTFEESYSNECFNHTLKFIESFYLKEPWAVRMYDSMEKIPFGVLYGHTTFIGNYDECLSVRTEDFRGKHCMVDFSFDKWEADDLSFSGLQITLGVCLPSTCHESDIRNLTSRLITTNVTVTVNEGDCSSDEPPPLSSEDYVAIFILGSVASVALLSTIYELQYPNDTGKRHELYSSFSLRKNWKQLMKIYDGPGNIGCLHGIRTLTMCWVVLAHEYVMSVMGPSINKIIVLEYINSKDKLLITNAFVSVDTFFLMSGLLVTLVFFRCISKTGDYDVPLAMIHRFIRITPAYFAMVLIQSTLISRMGSGPLWNRTVKRGADVCKENWWPGLLYIQNFVAPNSVCLGQSWYLSTDMQMFWLSPLLLYPLLMSVKIGLVTYVVYLVAALTTNIVIGIVFDLGPQIFITNATNQFAVDYVQTHTRLTPYIIGMGLGYIICGIKAKKIRFSLSKIWIMIGWLASSALCLGSIYGMSYFLDNGLDFKISESVSYLAFHRLGWSLGISWIIIACFAGYGGLINRFLSWNGFQVLGKLSYCMFLIHFSVQIFKTGMIRTNTYTGDFENVTRFFSTLVITAFLAILLHLLFEVPFCNIDRYFLRNVSIFPWPRRKVERNVKSTEGSTNAVEGAENKGYEEENVEVERSKNNPVGV